jgi:hypothetical protein
VRVGVSPRQVPKGGCPRPGLLSNGKCPNWLVRRPRAKQWAPQWAGERRTWHSTTTSRPGRAGSPSRRLMMDGKASKAVRSKIHSPEARGVNSAVWVQEREGHEG